MITRRKLIKQSALLAAFASSGFKLPATSGNKKRFYIGACDWSLGKNADPAVFEIAKKFYDLKDKNLQPMFDTFSFVSDELNGVNTDNTGIIRPKHYRRFVGGFDQMILENGLSRVWLGVHWSFDAFVLKNDGSIDLTKNTGGVPLGIKIANDVFDGGMGIQKSSV